LPFVSVHKWNPDAGITKQNMQVLKHCLENADVIINLAGHNPGEGPWTEKIKKKILDSRLNSINSLSEGLRQCSEK
jgi:NAD dependent epimerase/dehydratase family enzyme